MTMREFRDMHANTPHTHTHRSQGGILYFIVLWDGMKIQG